MENKSIYKYAAEAGLPTGIYLSLISACFLMSVKYSFLTTFFVPLSLFFPFYLGFILKRIAKLEPRYMKFSSLWLGGIYTVIFGTLICMLFSAIYLKFVEPGFIQILCNNLIATLETSPMSAEYAPQLEMLYKMQEAKLLPSAMDFVITMGWWTCFSGSVLSLLIALIISHKSKKVTNVIS